MSETPPPPPIDPDASGQPHDLRAELDALNGDMSDLESLEQRLDIPVDHTAKETDPATGAITVTEQQAALDSLEGVVSYSEKVYKNGAQHVYGETTDGKQVHLSHDKVLAAYSKPGEPLLQPQGTKEQFEARQARAAAEAAKKAEKAITPGEKAKRAAEAADFGMSLADYDAIMENTDLSVAQKFQKLAEAKPAADFAAEHPEGHKDYGMTAAEYRAIMDDSSMTFEQKVAQLEQYRDWAASILKEYGLRPREYRHIMNDSSLTLGQRAGKLERSRLWMKKFQEENGLDGAQYRTIMDDPGLRFEQKKALLDDAHKKHQSGVMATATPINSRRNNRPATARNRGPVPDGGAVIRPIASAPSARNSAETGGTPAPSLEGFTEDSKRLRTSIDELLRTRSDVVAGRGVTGDPAEAKRLQDERITELLGISPEEFDKTIKHPLFQTAENRAMGALENDLLANALRVEMDALSASIHGFGPEQRSDQERDAAVEKLLRLQEDYYKALEVKLVPLPRRNRAARRLGRIVFRGDRAA